MRAATQSIISLLLLHSSTAMTIPPAKPSLNKPGLKIAAGAALGNILQGFNTGVIGGALLYIVPEFQLDSRPEVTGLIASSTTMGATLGTLAAGKLLQEGGRKTTLIVSCALFLLGGVLMGLAPTTRF